MRGSESCANGGCDPTLLCVLMPLYPTRCSTDRPAHTAQIKEQISSFMSKPRATAVGGQTTAPAVSVNARTGTETGTGVTTAAPVTTASETTAAATTAAATTAAETTAAATGGAGPQLR